MVVCGIARVCGVHFISIRVKKKQHPYAPLSYYYTKCVEAVPWCCKCPFQSMQPCVISYPMHMYMHVHKQG